MVDSNEDNQEFPLQSGRLSRFSVLPNIPKDQQSTPVDEDINTEGTTENKDQNLDRTDISTKFNPFEVLPKIGQKLPSSAHSSLGYFIVEFPEHRLLDHRSDDTFDDGLCGVMTSTFQYMKQLLHDNDTIILVGVAGSGKTTLGRQLLECLKNEFTSVQIYSVTQLVRMVKFDENQFFFFDDAFGKDMSNFDKTLWKTLSCTWQEKVNKKKKDSKSSKLILSTRKECLPYNIPFASILVDMSKNSVFGHEDRKNMLLSHTNIINEKEIDKIIYRFDEEISNDIGFPLCSLLYTSTFFSLDATDFFADPLKFFLSSYQNLISESEMAECISKILVLNAGTFESDADLNSNTKMLINNITTVNDVLTFSNSVMRPFLNITNENIIQFIHPILLTAAEIHIFNIDQQEGLKYMSIKTISKYINIPAKLSKKKLFGILQVNYLSRNYLCLLADRMLSEVFDGNIRHVCSHPLLKKQEFINDFQNALQKKYRNGKDQMIQILYDFFLTVDDIFCDGILFWSAHYGNTNFCDMLLKHFGRCRKHEDLPLNILSRALIGACLNSKSLILVLQLVKYGADISYCEACFKLDAPSIKFEVIGNGFHFCPLQAVIQSGNLQSFKYLLKKGATIIHSAWIQWELLCKLAEVSNILASSFDFVLALEETFSKGRNLDNVTIRQPGNEGLYSNFKAMLKDIQDPSDINDIFFTFIHHSFISQAICEVFNSFGLDITYCDRKQRNAINVLLWKYKEDPQRITLNEVSCLRILLKIGIDPNNTAVDGTFPLCLAIGEKSINIQVIQLLLQAGASVDSRTLDGLTPLHLCIKSYMPLEQKLSLISLLLECGAKRNETDLRKRTYAQVIFEQPPIHSSVLLKVSNWPLHDCLCSGLCETVKIRIIKELVSEDIDVNTMDRQNQTPILLSACKLNNMLLTKTILSLGGDANILYEGNYSIIQKLLLSRHANVEGIFSVLIEAFENVYHVNEEGDTALLTALKCRKNRFREIKTLLNMTMIDLTKLETKNKNQQSVLHLATASNALTDAEACDICKTYISVCGRINDRDMFDKTALEYASLCSKHRPKCICLLLKHSDIFEIESKFLLNLIQNGHMSDEVATVLFNAKYYDFILQEDEHILHKLASIQLDDESDDDDLSLHGGYTVSSDYTSVDDYYSDDDYNYDDFDVDDEDDDNDDYYNGDDDYDDHLQNWFS
ncbi:uncharacterized protein LOC127708535 [Mytilus californianus]|uniref:uncharacterized protein LOC127708535 n=1 Tax=Mytilus californianus TaxID=6549 RepID=UPI002245532A|nr:uncharacterized protein LOC127708535 [Mytilus californianus]